jgi:CRISPR/Cas system-associated endoribonuclease Cas2
MSTEYDISELKKRVGDLEEIVASMRQIEQNSTFAKALYRKLAWWLFADDSADVKMKMQYLREDVASLKSKSN